MINLQLEPQKVSKMEKTTRENEPTLESDEDITTEKKVPQQICKKCRKEFNEDDNTCPHCGYTEWGIFIAMTIIGLIVVPVAIFFMIRSIDNEGVVMEKLDFFLSVIGGFIAAVMLFRGLSVIRNAWIIKKRLKK